MTGLGEQFIWTHIDRLAGIKRLLLICTNEDANCLDRGVLHALDSLGDPEVKLACFWNDRHSIEGPTSGFRVELAPIVRRYVEPGEVDAFLVVKAIISSACVVRTNITEMVYVHDSARMLIYAQVILKGAERRLCQEFSDDVSRRFEFFSFAQDDDKEGDNVKPGIGGQVYERLGIGTNTEKNRFTPELVKERPGASPNRPPAES